MNVRKRIALVAGTAVLGGGLALAPAATAVGSAPAETNTYSVSEAKAGGCKHKAGVGYTCGHYEGRATQARGSAGKDVKEVQALMKYHWKTSAGKRLAVDGKFGPKTEAAVKAFQRQINKDQKPSPALKVDGIVGPNTWWWLRY
ncbi:peptidoglycan-binding domain-containing protein [Streptomyces pseudoechinosporeus]